MIFIDKNFPVRPAPSARRFQLNAFYFAIIIIIISACSGNEKEVAVGPVIDSVKSLKSAAIMIDSSPVILKPWMIARGSEPGWFAQFYDDSVCLELDHGAKKLHFAYDFTKAEDGNFTANIKSDIVENGKQTEEEIKIIVELKSCTEEGSGEKRERAIQLFFAGKKYVGCATVDL